jgi:ATP/maltotriose-dependent transcriptional regulator MalT
MLKPRWIAAQGRLPAGPLSKSKGIFAQRHTARRVARLHPKNSRGETCIPFALIQKLAARLSSEALTNRELEVPELLPRGRSNQKMGATLFIGETTVKSHLRNIFGKSTS